MHNILGIVKVVIGQVFAIAVDGTQRELHEGDRIFAGEEIVTSANGALTVNLSDGHTMDMGRNSHWSDQSGVTAAANTEHATDDVVALQQAITDGVDPTKALEATAAGNEAPIEAGTGGGGHFIERVELTGEVVDATSGFPTTGLGSLVHDHNQFDTFTSPANDSSSISDDLPQAEVVAHVVETPLTTPTPAEVPQAELTPAFVPQTELTPAFVPQTELTPAFVPQTELTPAFVPQTELTPAFVPQTELTPAFVPQTELTPAFVPQTELTPAFVPQTELTPAFVPQTELTPAFVPQTELTPAFVAQTELTPAFLPQTELTPAFVPQTELTPAFVPQTELTPAFVPQTELTPAFVPQTDLTPAFVPQTELTPAFVPQTELTPAFVPQTELTPAFVPQTELTPAFVPQTELTPAFVPQTELTPAFVPQTELTPAFVPQTELTPAFVPQTDLTPAFVPQTELTPAFVPQTELTPAFVPQTELTPAFVPQTELTPAFVPQTELTPAFVPQTELTPAFVPQTDLTPAFVPQTELTPAFVPQTELTPAFVPQTELTPAFVPQTELTPAFVPQTELTPAFVPQTELTPAFVPQTELTPAFVPQTELTPAFLPQTELTPAFVPQTELTPAFVPQTELTPAFVPQTELTPAFVPQTELTPAFVPQTELTPAFVPQTELTPAFVPQTELTPAFVPLTELTPAQVPLTDLTPAQVPLTDLTPAQVPLTDLTPAHVPLTDLTPAQVPLTDLTSAHVPLTDLTPAQVSLTELTPAQVPLTDLTPAHVPLTDLTPAQVPLTNLTPAQVPLTELTPAHVPLTDLTPAQVPLTELKPAKHHDHVSITIDSIETEEVPSTDKPDSGVTHVNGGSESPDGFDVKDGKIVSIGSNVRIHLSENDPVPGCADSEHQILHYNDGNEKGDGNYSDVFVVHPGSQYIRPADSYHDNLQSVKGDSQSGHKDYIFLQDGEGIHYKITSGVDHPENHQVNSWDNVSVTGTDGHGHTLSLNGSNQIAGVIYGDGTSPNSPESNPPQIETPASEQHSTITGTVTGDVALGDIVKLTVNGHHYKGEVVDLGNGKLGYHIGIESGDLKEGLTVHVSITVKGDDGHATHATADQTVSHDQVPPAPSTDHASPAHPASSEQDSSATITDYIAHNDSTDSTPEAHPSPITQVNGGSGAAEGFDIQDGKIVAIGSNVRVWLSDGDTVPHSADSANQITHYHDGNVNSDGKYADIYVVHDGSGYTNGNAHQGLNAINGMTQSVDSGHKGYIFLQDGSEADYKCSPGPNNNANSNVNTLENVSITGTHSDADQGLHLQGVNHIEGVIFGDGTLAFTANDSRTTVVHHDAPVPADIPSAAPPVPVDDVSGHAHVDAATVVEHHTQQAHPLNNLLESSDDLFLPAATAPADSATHQSDNSGLVTGKGEHAQERINLSDLAHELEHGTDITSLIKGGEQPHTDAAVIDSKAHAAPVMVSESAGMDSMQHSSFDHLLHKPEHQY